MYTHLHCNVYNPIQIIRGCKTVAGYRVGTEHCYINVYLYIHIYTYVYNV